MGLAPETSKRHKQEGKTRSSYLLMQTSIKLVIKINHGTSEALDTE